MSIGEKLTTIAENEQRVYDGGFDKGERAMWDLLTKNGTREFYEYGFYQCNFEYFRPPYKIVPTSRDIAMFSYCSKLKKIEKDYLDLSNITTGNSADGTNSNYAVFRGCINLEEVEDIGIPAGGYYLTFGWCSKLHTVHVMRCKAEGGYTNPFSNCSELRNLTIEGEIGKNFTMSSNGKLTIDSLKSIINALVDYTGTSNEYKCTLTLNSGCRATLEAEGATSPNGNTWIEYIDDKKWNLTM